MKKVSEAYKESMKSPLRNRSYVEITVLDGDYTAAGNGTLTSSSLNSALSTANNVKYDIDYNASGATCELNHWALDGTSVIVPKTNASGVVEKNHEGIVTSAISDDGGTFSEAQDIVFNFATAIDFPGVTVIFDSRQKEYPSQVYLTFYDANSKLIKDVTVSPTSYTLLVESAVTDCTMVQISASAALPHRRLRVERIAFGLIETFTNDNILSVDQSHDVDPLSRRLPQETCQFTIADYGHKYDPDNPNGVYEYIDAGAPVKIRYGYELDDGSVEWLKGDRYRLDGKPTVANNQVSFTGTGLIASLGGTYYKDRENYNGSGYPIALNVIAENVLQDAKLGLSNSGTTPWDISKIPAEYTQKILPIDSHMNCLQMIAHACRCKLYSDDDNIIHIDPFEIPTTESETTDFLLDFSTISRNAQSVSRIDKLKQVDIIRYTYNHAEESSELYNETVDNTDLHIEFNQPAYDVTVSCDPASALTECKIYARAADLKMASGSKTITVTGKTLEEVQTTISYKYADDGEIDTEDNPLPSSPATREALAEHVAKYLQLRNTYEISYRGNPELECGDIITIQTPYNDNIKALILTDEISFNGSLSGKLKVKAIT